MKKLEDLLEEIKKMDELLKDLERRYEDEADEKKSEVIWRRAERTEARLDKLIDKADAIREKEETKEPEKKADEKVEEEDSEEDLDEDVCPSCGGDLIEEEDGMLFCEACYEYYEKIDEEVKE
jgi:light-regulated signal transduction histidine kinase (bacteriophytochrome)